MYCIINYVRVGFSIQKLDPTFLKNQSVSFVKLYIEKYLYLNKPQLICCMWYLLQDNLLHGNSFAILTKAMLSDDIWGFAYLE